MRIDRRTALFAAGWIFFSTLILWWSLKEDADVAAPVDSLAALREGNRLFRNGQIDAAIDLYRRGYDPASPHATLAYNLGTALHHAGELPEAVLWYRRAEALDDPWQRENLDLARRTLGTEAQTLPDTTRLWIGSTGAMRACAALTAWIGALFLGLDGPRRVKRWLPFALAAVVLFGAAVRIDAGAPVAAVLLADCVGDAEQDERLAGTEVWGRPEDGGFKLRETGAVCGEFATVLPQ